MITLQAETQRVAEHFVRAGKLVSERDTSQLDAAQQLVRQLILEEVGRYGAARQFPKNHDSEALRPTFIDAQGTPCAMAHLLQFAGAGELATRISQETCFQQRGQLRRGCSKMRISFDFTPMP